MNLHLNIKRKNSVRIFIYNIMAHVLIFLISLFEISILIQLNVEEFWFAFVFLNILLLYFVSGYFLTKDKVIWYRYTGIAIIGIVLWLLCIAKSPESLNYKSNEEAGLWFYYRLYIAGIESPLNYITNYNKIGTKQIVYILMYPIIASLLQYLGAVFKIKRPQLARASRS